MRPRGWTPERPDIATVFSDLAAGPCTNRARGIPPGQSVAPWYKLCRVATVERARPMNTCRSGRCMTMRAVSLAVERSALALVSAAQVRALLVLLLTCCMCSRALVRA